MAEIDNLRRNVMFAVENIRRLNECKALIRAEVEEHWQVEHDQEGEPDEYKEAQAIVEAIASMCRFYEERISNLESDVEGAYYQVHRTKHEAEQQVQRARNDARHTEENAALREAGLRREAKRKEEQANWNRLLGRRY